MVNKKYQVKSLGLSNQGKKKIAWATQAMLVIHKMIVKYQSSKPLRGINIAACMHVTSETANLMILLKAAGAKVNLCASNPLSTQDEVAASLVKDYSINVYAIRGASRQDYYKHLNSVLTKNTNMTMDDGADLVNLVHTKRNELLKNMIGGTEETTTGVIRLKALAKQGKLGYPIVAVNDAKTKHFFDNRYGTGQSTIDGIIRATNILLAGKVIVVAGYGWCGRGVAMRAKGHGAQVVVTEVDPVRALEARMDGFEVMPMMKAARIGDIFVTATGDIKVLDTHHFKVMKSGAVLANTGHFDVEINIKGLKKMSSGQKDVRPQVMEYTFGNKKINIIAQGRLVNLSAAEGHPAQVMDMSFAGQFMAAKYIKDNRRKLENKVYLLPEKQDMEIAILKLKTMGIAIDKLTQEQAKYLSSWEIGT